MIDGTRAGTNRPEDACRFRIASPQARVTTWPEHRTGWRWSPCGSRPCGFRSLEVPSIVLLGAIQGAKVRITMILGGHRKQLPVQRKRLNLKRAHRSILARSRQCGNIGQLAESDRMAEAREPQSVRTAPSTSGIRPVV